MLSKNNPRVWELGNVNAFTLAPDAVVYHGAALGDNGAGLARPLVAGDKFLGFAESAASTFTGDDAVRVLVTGLVQLRLTGLKATSLYALVYASDDDSFNLSQGSLVGTIYRVLDTGEAIVAFGYQAYPPLAPHRLLVAGKHKTTGGAAIEKISLPGLLPSDIAHVTLGAQGKTPCSIQSVTPTVGSLHVGWNADPSNDHLLHYVVYRSVAG